MSDKKFMDNPIVDTEVEIRKIVNSGYRFSKKVTLVSAKAGIPLVIMTKSAVEQLAKALGLTGIKVEGFKMKVDGTTIWGTVANVKIQSTANTPQDLVTVPVAQLTANAFLNENSTVTLDDVYTKGLFVPDGEGIQVVADVDGTGDNLVVQVWGRVE